jgi:DNA polymerase
MEGYGVTLPDLKADTVERRLEDESLPEHIKELLRIRQQASKASTAKYKRVLTQQVGGRLRNLLVFCGAMRTGRWSGRTLQPQNLPRPKHSAGDIAGAIVAFHEKAMDIYDPDNCLGLASSCLRGLIVAGPRCKLVVADLANIEGRDMAFIAGEQWKLDAFAKFDAGLGPDMYKLSYGRAFGIDPNTIGDDDERRQIGKVMELALQYYGGVGAFCAMAETYGLKLEHLAESAWKSIPAGVLSRAREAFRRATKRRKTYGLDERTYLVCQSLVLMWRDAHPAIVKFWADLDTAFRSAIRTENVAYKAGKVVVDRKGNWVRIKLPSGRYLSYPGTRVGADDNQMRFMGVNPYSRQWGRIGTYNGKLAENIVQASSADILMDGIMAAEMAGYSPEISVHDEIISEPPDSPEYTAAGLSKLMCESSAWTKGMPLSAKGWEGQRYRK